MKEIREWLERGQDYAQGVALYETYGSSQVVLKALRYGATEFTRQKLKKELEKLVSTSEPAERLVDTSVKRVPVPPKVAPAPAQEASSPEVQAQRRTWFAERNHLHPQLELVATDAERLAMSLRILELGDLLTQSYQAAPALAPTQPPAGHLEELTDAGEIRRLLANLRPQRTKLKKRPDRATDLAQVEAAIQILESKLTTSHV